MQWPTSRRAAFPKVVIARASLPTRSRRSMANRRTPASGSSSVKSERHGRPCVSTRAIRSGLLRARCEAARPTKSSASECSARRPTVTPSRSKRSPGHRSGRPKRSLAGRTWRCDTSMFPVKLTVGAAAGWPRTAQFSPRGAPMGRAAWPMAGSRGSRGNGPCGPWSEAMAGIWSRHSTNRHALGQRGRNPNRKGGHTE